MSESKPTLAERFPKVYAAVKTAVVSFIALYSVTLIGWLGDVADWAGGTSAFPSTDALGKGFVSAFAAAAVGLLTFLVNWAQEHGFPGAPARYPSAPPPPAE